MSILKYKNHPSILIIRNTGENSIFCFKELTIEEITKEINKLRSKKVFQNNVSTRIVKENLDIIVGFLCKNINTTFKSSMFLNSLKLADITNL